MLTCHECGQDFTMAQFNNHFCDGESDDFGDDADQPIAHRPAGSIYGVPATEELRRAAAIVLDAWSEQDEADLDTFAHSLVRGEEG